MVVIVGGLQMKRNLLVSVAVVAFGLSDSAMAADVQPPRMSAKAPSSTSYDWTGPYVGFHFGYGSGRFGDGSSPLPLQGVFFPPSISGLIGGYQAGYNHQFANGLVLGLEADMTFMSPVDVPRLEPAPFNTTFNYLATVRGRFGKAFGNVLPYVTAGVAWGQTKLELNDVNGDPLFADRSANHLGWTVGIGIEHVLTGNWTAKYEYNYIDLGSRTYRLDLPAMPE